MTKTELRLEYQKVTGDSLDTVNRKADEGNSDYVEWLEERLLKIGALINLSELFPYGTHKTQ